MRKQRTVITLSHFLPPPRLFDVSAIHSLTVKSEKVLRGVDKPIEIITVLEILWGLTRERVQCGGDAERVVARDETEDGGAHLVDVQGCAV